MQFELTKEYLDRFRQAIKGADSGLISKQIADLYPADIAEILDELDLEERKSLFQHLKGEDAADVLVELEEDVRIKFLASLSSKEIAEQFIESMDSDDAADVIAELPEEVKDEVILHIKDSEQASHIVDLLHYDENSAGGLMAKELIAVNKDWTVMKCVKEMRKQAEDMDDVYAVYVVDNKNILLGLLSLNKLLIAQTETTISDIYEKEVVSVKTNTKSEEVANIMNKYDLVVLPVVDTLGRLAGRITIDDVVDVIKEEAEKDYQMASGISGDIDFTDKAWVLSRARLPWLIIGLIGGILGARVIGMYEDDIKIYPEMAFFIPLIGAMGGNAGVQSSAIIVRGLANDTLGMESIFSKLIKVLGVAMINGLICAVLILGYNLFFSDSMSLSLTVSVALFSVIIFATIFGTFVPLLLDKYKINPALATGPFITTVNDVLGLFLYFLIGKMMYV